MPLHPPGPRRERLLGYGESGSGKTTLWLDIAEWIHKTNSKSKMFVEDTDVAWEAMRPTDGHLDGIVRVFDVADYKETKAATKDILAVATPDDWLVFDMVDKLWSYTQQHYFSEIYDADLGEFFLAARQKGVSVAADWNWSYINKLYSDVFDRLFRFKGHLLCVAPATEVREPDRAGKGGDEAQVRQLFKPVGMRPQGQKDLSYFFHTIVYTQEAPSGWVYRTVKDRQRERKAGVSLKTGFTLNYLIPVAGWRP